MTHIEKRIEIRTCIKCGETKEIVQNTKHNKNVCKECSRKQQREYQRKAAIEKGTRVGATGRVPYPTKGEYPSANTKFRKMAIVTFKTKSRDEWIQLMRKRLEDVLNDRDVMEWINTHGNKENITKTKEDSAEYNNMTWEDYEKGGWGDDVDS